MRSRHPVSFRPEVQSVEDRCLATVHPLVANLGLHGLAGRTRAVAVQPVRSGHVVVMAGGGGGSQGALPSNYRNWGVITVWNTTTARVTFSVSASTYQAGRYFNFMLRPGAYQSYYARFDSFNNDPIFHVSLDPINRTNSIQLSDINTVFERNNWVPRVGTEGRPYAITTDVSGLNLTSIG